MSATEANRASLLIVGNGMATGRLLDELIARDAGRYEITVVGDEPQGSYNRIMLSPVLAGETQVESILSKPPGWYRDNHIRFIAGQLATAIDRQAQTVTLENGEHLSYDHLVLATGSRPARIPAANQSLTNIFSFRTLGDVDRILEAAGRTRRALVIGGGLLGLEAAYGLASKGLPVTLVHRSGWPLNRQLDSVSGEFLQQVMADKGVDFRLSDQVERFVGEDKVEGAQLASGDTLGCDLVVIATGITPNKELAEEAGIRCGRGIVVDDFMVTDDHSVSALGECCEHNGQTFGLVEPIWHQCRALADRLAGDKPSAFINPVVATKLKVSGVNLFSAGEYLTGEHHREIVMVDKRHRIYRKLLLRDDKIQGAVLFGDTRDGQAYFDLMTREYNLPAVVHSLPLGKAFCPDVFAPPVPGENEENAAA